MSDKLADELKAEYTILQSHYENFDNRIITIKSWATLLVTGGIAVGIKEKSVLILVLAIFASLTLWVLEAIWKSFQYCYSARIQRIERWFRGQEKEGIAPFQIFTGWNAEYARHFRNISSLPRIMRQPFVLIPYVLIAALGVVGAIWVVITR